MNQWSPASVSVRALEWMDSQTGPQTDLPKRSNRSLHNVAHCGWWWSMVDGRCWLGALIDLSHNRWSLLSLLSSLFSLLPPQFGMECGSHILLSLSLASGLIKRHSFWIKIKWIKLKACNALSHGGCHNCHVASCQLKSCNKIVFNLIAPSGQPRAF